VTRPARQRPSGNTGISLPAHVESLAPNQLTPAPAAAVTAEDSIKAPLSTRIPASLLEAARDAVIATAGHPDGVRSLAELVTVALQSKIAQLTAELNEGQPFPQRRGGAFRTGRPLG